MSSPRVSRRRRRSLPARAQALSEAILILALVAIATVGIVGLFGDNLRRLFAGSSDSLAGGDKVVNAGHGHRSSQKRTLKNFGETGSAGSQMGGN